MPGPLVRPESPTRLRVGPLVGGPSHRLQRRLRQSARQASRVSDKSRRCPTSRYARRLQRASRQKRACNSTGSAEAALSGCRRAPMRGSRTREGGRSRPPSNVAAHARACGAPDPPTDDAGANDEHTRSIADPSRPQESAASKRARDEHTRSSSVRPTARRRCPLSVKTRRGRPQGLTAAAATPSPRRPPYSSPAAALPSSSGSALRMKVTTGVERSDTLCLTK